MQDELPEEVAVDSETMLPLIFGERQEGRKSVIHHSILGNFSIRRGEWKLEVCAGSGGWTSPTEKEAVVEGLPALQLYNMRTDESETTNQVDRHPEVVESLLAELSQEITRGRSTPGEPQPNDVEIDLFKRAT